MKQQTSGYPAPASNMADAMAEPDKRLGHTEGCLSRTEMDRLYRDDAPKLRRFFRNRVRDADAADDLVQEPSCA